MKGVMSPMKIKWANIFQILEWHCHTISFKLFDVCSIYIKMDYLSYLFHSTLSVIGQKVESDFSEWYLKSNI